MRVEELHLKGFGKWQDAVFRFAPGINVFAAPNEAGKSTLLQGIFAALYGLKRDYVRSARYLPEYERYRPWHQGEYETIVRYQLAGKTYRLHRYLSKEREQARIFLDPEWTELTDVYQEDRRKERDFLEKHLGLTRSLFTDITWIRREPLSAAQHLLSSLTDAREDNPAVQHILSELERELAAIGKKERAEHTGLGKAASLVAQKEQERAHALSVWKVVTQLTRQIADWEEERKKEEQRRSRLQQKMQRCLQREQDWQERWQLSYALPDDSEWEWWESTAAAEEEQQIHRETRMALATVRAAKQSAVEEELPRKIDLERLEADYEAGMQLRMSWEACQKQLAGMSAVPAARRQGRADKQTATKKRRAGFAWGSAGLFAVLAVASSYAGHAVLGGAALALAAVAAGYAWKVSRSHLARAGSGESAVTEEWLRLQQEAARLEDELLQLVRCWGAAEWNEFLVMRDRFRSREQARLAATISLRDEEERIASRWGESVRSFLQREKEAIVHEKQACSSELNRTEERLLELREKIARANGELISHEGISVAQAESEHAEALSRLHHLQKKREALQLARDTLQEALAEWNRDVAGSVSQHASRVMEQISGGVYRDVRLDPRDSFAVRLLEPKRQLVLEQEQCSTGTQDQLTFAQRLALLRHVSSQTEPLPVFLDDHFVHYDQTRLEEALAYLVELSHEHQIFLFSCHDRERALLEPVLRASRDHAVHSLG